MTTNENAEGKTALGRWMAGHGYGELCYDYWMGWYEHGRRYTADRRHDEALKDLERKAIRISSGGRDNFALVRAQAAEVIERWSDLTRDAYVA